MSATEQRTISINLSPEDAKYIDAKVASGRYASMSEVVLESLRNSQERDEEIERWLREEVVPTYDEMRAHPERGIPAEEVFAKLKTRLTEQQKRKKH